MADFAEPWTRRVSIKRNLNSDKHVRHIDVFRIEIHTLSFSGLIEPTDDHGDCPLG
jgi:hypothetical protein